MRERAYEWSESEDMFLVTDVLRGPLGRLLVAPFASTDHSADSLRSAPLHPTCFACLLHSQARSLTWLTPPGTVEISENMFML